VNIRDDELDDEPAMNLTPMIDVIFQLLIFFMVATTFQDPEREIDVELPEASTGELSEAEREEIVINVLRDGSLVLSGETISREALLRRLARAADLDPDTPVTIRGDRLVHHEKVVGVMDACGSVGLTSFSLGTLEGR
jgi:biopolymer transport protein ExbD